ncbi:MAG: hypothetical protein ACOYEF_09440 [Planifilum sp.]|jgi:hypothetical protein
MKPRCYLVVANAPDSLKLREANALFNKYIGDRKRGHCVYHDHFMDRPGGVAFFAIENEEQKENLKHDLKGWKLEIHPLIESRSAAGFVYQLDYTSSNYAGIPLDKLIQRIEEAEEKGMNPLEA